MRAIFVVATIILALGASARVAPRWNELEGYTFRQYCADFGKEYQDASTLKKRQLIFEERLEEIKNHNKDLSLHRRGVNQFSDWTREEWKSYNRARVDRPTSPPKDTVTDEDAHAAPHVVDYRLWNAPRVLTGVKNQGACGNCWVHGSIESMESYFAIQTGQLPVLSTQQITSCDINMMGCGGGDISSAFDYVKNLKQPDGLNEEWVYPFTDFFSKNFETAACYNVTKKFTSNFFWYAKLGLDGYQAVTKNDAKAAMKGLAQNGPYSISVAASTWMDYEGGVFVQNNSNPASWEIDHVVQLVGYGVDFGADAKPYWIVRNSWGTTWGEDGFIRLWRPEHEPCGHFEGEKICGTSGVISDLKRPYVHELKKKNP